MTVRELGARLRSGEISSAQLTEEALALAKEHASLGAFITVTADQARERARELDQELRNGIDRGPFHGIPIALKDLFYTRGIRTTAGSLVYQDFVPEFDADVVQRLREAGAISIGKTNLHELAFGITSLNPHFGPVANPLDRLRLAGGSSGGSAAVIAAGMVPMALGTDTGGSIRIPASFCGIVGLKPTYGRVSRHGAFPLAFSLDHVGPLGSCVEDCALAMNVIADEREEFNLPELPGLKSVRVGIPRAFFFDRLEKGVGKRVGSALAAMEHAGAAVSDISAPNFGEINAAASTVQFAEFASLYTSHTSPKLFGRDVWALLETGRQIKGHDYVNAQRLRTLFRREMDKLWQTTDLLATPTTAVAAPLSSVETVKFGKEVETVRMASTRLVRGFNFLGEPVLSMPCGRTSNGLPVGLQLIGPPFSEPRLLQVAKTLERMLER